MKRRRGREKENRAVTKVNEVFLSFRISKRLKGFRTI